MNYATIKNCDIANGPGVRISLFVSGCTHRCKGCFNEVAWDFDYGQPFTQETVEEILNMLAPPHIAGITLLGGEPFEPQNQPALLDLLRQIKAKMPEKSIWAFSGYLFEKDILAGRLGPKEITQEFVSYLDVLLPKLGIVINAEAAFWVFYLLGQLCNLALHIFCTPKVQTTSALFAQGSFQDSKSVVL